ncbi:MAG: response regulator [Myxococcota bacterium]
MGSRVLIIDAEADFAKQLAETLNGGGLEATIAADGKVGLDLAKQLKPSAIVVCVELPRMSGYSVCTKIRKDDALKSIAVVITSSGATPETFESHSRLSTRADEYLKKPFPPAMLLDVLRPHLGLPAAPQQEGGEEVDILDDDVIESPETLSDDEAFSAEEAHSLTTGQYDHGRPDSNTGAVLSTPAALPDDVAAEGIDEAEALTTVGMLEDASPLPPNTPPPKPASAIAAATVPSAKDTARDRRLESLEAELERTQRDLEEARRQRDEALTEAQKSVVPTSIPSSAPGRELLELKKERNAKEKEILALKEQLNDKEKDLIRWRDKEAELEAEIVELRESLERSERDKGSLEHKLAQDQKSSAQTIQDLKRRLAESSSREADLDGTVQALSAEVDGLKAQIEGLERARAEKDAEAQKLTKDLQHAGVEKTRLEGEVRRTRDDLGKTATERDALKQERETLRSERDNLKTERDRLKTERDGLEADLAGARGEIEQHVDAHGQTQMRLAEVERSLGSERDRLSAEVVAFSAEVDRVTAEAERLVGEVDRLQNEYSATQAEAKGLREQLRNRDEEIETLGQQIRGLEGAVTGERTEKDGLRSLIEEISAERERGEGLLSNAYQRIRDDEGIRGKALQALEIAVALLKEAGYTGATPNAERPSMDADGGEASPS